MQYRVAHVLNSLWTKPYFFYNNFLMLEYHMIYLLTTRGGLECREDHVSKILTFCVLHYRIYLILTF